MFHKFTGGLAAILLAAACSLAIGATPASAQNIVQNGGFEGGTTPWTFSGFNDPIVPGASYQAGFGRNGSAAYIYRQRVTPGVIAQPLNTVAGKTYTVSFWIAASAGSTITPKLGTTSGTTITVPTTNSWQQFTTDIVAPVSNAGLSFEVLTNGTSTYERIDDVSVSAAIVPVTVPTMTEWAMILLGVMLAGGAALMIQRQRMAA